MAVSGFPSKVQIGDAPSLHRPPWAMNMGVSRSSGFLFDLYVLHLLKNMCCVPLLV